MNFARGAVANSPVTDWTAPQKRVLGEGTVVTYVPPGLSRTRHAANELLATASKMTS